METGHSDKSKATILLEHAQKAGKDPKFVFPQTDDIIVTEGVGWNIVGPVDQNELDLVLANCQRRDHMLMQAVLEERLATKAEQHAGDTSIEQRPGATPWFMSHFMNDRTLLRFKMNTTDTIMLRRKYERMSKRELLKHACNAWRQQGDPKPRCWRMPALVDQMPRFKGLFGVIHDVFDCAKTGNPMSEGVIVERL